MPGPLRSYFAYGNTAPVWPTFHIDGKGTATNTLQRSCYLATIDGYCSVANKYLQLFDRSTALSGGEVPLRSWNIAAAGPLPSFFGQLGPITLFKGALFALSSTGGTYTADASSFDIEGEVIEWEKQHVADTEVGDLTTGLNHLQVWTEASGPYRLTRVDVTNGWGAQAYLMIFAKDNPVNGDKPMEQIKLLSTDTARLLAFGEDGLIVYAQDANGTAHQGCTLSISSTSGSLTLITNATSKLRAFYV